MHIAIHSASSSVRRTLESIITAAGHSVVSQPAEAMLILHDTIHPATAPLPAIPTLELTATPTPDETGISCPLRPQTLIQRLMMRTQTIALENGWSLDCIARQLTHPNHTLALTEKEVSLLKALAVARPKPITRETLLGQVWGMQSEMDTHTLETHIYRLRGKLSALTPPPTDILTQNGAYLLAFGPKPL